MLIIVGLGNPGRDYAGHRHNVGFMAVDEIHRRHRFGPWRSRFSAEIADGTLSGRKVLLMKPSTYMNESGRAVGEAARFFKVPPIDIVAIHDEVDLPPGKTRIKTGGGEGGHNGLRSLTAHLGPDYRRIRIGVGHPGRKEAVPGYVLHDFSKADGEWLGPLLAAIADNANLLADEKDATFANRLHRAVTPEPVRGSKPGKPEDAAARDTAGGDKATGDAAPARPGKPDPAPPFAGEPKPAEGPLASGLKRLFTRGS